MTYRVNDIFSSLQGEGHNTGRAATFVRFAGCNLRCAFCDTEFSDYREMTAGEIVGAIMKFPTRFVVLTGGEPSLQADRTLVDALRRAYEIKVVFDGKRDPWDFLPPTPGDSTLLYLQPCDTGDTVRNKEILGECIAYIKAHPEWRLSLQTHKLANFK